ncbi:MAG: hypothetical protein WC889_13215 [Myxococcota bacterium]|jgi:hypothetical protein
MRHKRFEMLAGAFFVGLVSLTFTLPALAGPPLITDDVNIAGKGRIQLDSTLHYDQNGLIQNNKLSLDPVDWLELTVGFDWGWVDASGGSDKQPGIAAPSVQIKARALKPENNGLPGLSFALSTSMPFGTKAFADKVWNEAFNLALTENLLEGDRLLISVNGGVFLSQPPDGLKAVFTWGVSLEVKVVAGLSFVGELVSGDPDPYRGTNGGAWQTGIRYTFNDSINISATVGDGIWGNPVMPLWGLLGFTYVSKQLF